MTVSNSTYRVSYNGDGSTTSFSIPFYFINNSDLSVTKQNTDGSETTFVLGSDYNLTGAGDLAGGTLTTTGTLASGEKITIERDAQFTQSTDYEPFGRFPAETLEQNVDKLTMLAQQVKALTDRAYLLDRTTSFLNSSIEEPVPGSYLRYDASGNIINGGSTVTSTNNYLYPDSDAVSRSITNKFADIISVKDFGATGDNSTDDSVAIRNAFDALTDGGMIYFPPGRYVVSPTNYTIDETSVGGNAGETYSAIVRIDGKDNFAIEMAPGAFLVEAGTPATIYHGFLLSNCTNFHVKANFYGASVLTDAMVASTNPLDTAGCELVTVLFNCYQFKTEGIAYAARSHTDTKSGSPSDGNQWNDANIPSSFQCNVVVKNCKYGTRFSRARNTIVDISGDNCKRTYRLDSGENHQARVNLSARDMFSWDAGTWGVLAQGVSGYDLENFTLDYNCHSADYLINLECDGTNSDVKHAFIRLNYFNDNASDNGEVLTLFNGATNNTTGNNNTWKNITISGNIVTTAENPIRLSPAPSTNTTDTSCKIENLTFINLNILSSDCVEPIRWQNLGLASTQTTVNPKFINVQIQGTQQSSGDGELTVKSASNPLLIGYRNDMSGTGFTNDTKLVFDANCSGVVLTNAKLGHLAGDAWTTDLDNVAVGVSAAENHDGDDCVFVGKDAGKDRTSNEDYHVAVGSEALSGASTSQFGNTAIGYQAGKSCTGTGNQIFGYGAGDNITGDNNSVVGRNALKHVTTDNNSALGVDAGTLTQAGVNQTTYSNTTCLGHNSRVSASDQVQIGDSSTTTYVYGTVQNRSDERDKADIRDTELGLDFIDALRPVDFKWDMRDDYIVPQHDEKGNLTGVSFLPKDGSNKRTRYHHGLIAQEVKATLDSLGVDFGGYQDHKINNGEDVLSIGYDELIGPLIKAVQELKARVEALEGE
jgi:hypothetical protein